LFSELKKNQKSMNHFDNPQIRQDYCACCEMFSLFIQLGIPPQEQTILLNMANKRIGCKALRNILVLLQRNKTLK
jgi:hypothetical protein